MAFYENIDGAGTFGPQLVITTFSSRDIKSIFAKDVDTDSDLDLVCASERGIFWYENLLAHPGDANRDGRFDHLDLVQVLQAGKYLSGLPATWSEGDWNMDGVFDQDDLVAALQTRGYRPRPPTTETTADWFVEPAPHTPELG